MSPFLFSLYTLFLSDIIYSCSFYHHKAIFIRELYCFLLNQWDSDDKMCSHWPFCLGCSSVLCAHSPLIKHCWLLSRVLEWDFFPLQLLGIWVVGTCQSFFYDSLRLLWWIFMSSEVSRAVAGYYEGKKQSQRHHWFCLSPHSYLHTLQFRVMESANRLVLLASSFSLVTSTSDLTSRWPWVASAADLCRGDGGFQFRQP